MPLTSHLPPPPVLIFFIRRGLAGDVGAAPVLCGRPGLDSDLPGGCRLHRWNWVLLVRRVPACVPMREQCVMSVFLSRS